MGDRYKYDKGPHRRNKEIMHDLSSYSSYGVTPPWPKIAVRKLKRIPKFFFAKFFMGDRY